MRGVHGGWKIWHYGEGRGRERKQREGEKEEEREMKRTYDSPREMCWMIILRRGEIGKKGRRGER